MIVPITPTPTPPVKWVVTITATETSTATPTATPDCCKLGGHVWESTARTIGGLMGDMWGYGIVLHGGTEFVCVCKRCHLVNRNVNDCVRRVE